MSLVAHKDTRRVEESVVMAVPEPEFTKTWHPLSHKKVIIGLQAACKDKGFEILDSKYSMSADGGKMFGVWDIFDGGGADKCYSIGFRNAINKSLGLGFVAGNKVFVCDNMVFNGEFITFRRHTGRLDEDELIDLTNSAVDTAVEHIKKLNLWHDDLKNYEISDVSRKELTFDFMKAGIVPPSKFNQFNDAVEAEFQIAGEHSLYAMHGGVTRLVRDNSLFKIAKTSKKLNIACDEWIAKAA